MSGPADSDVDFDAAVCDSVVTCSAVGHLGRLFG